MPKTTEQNSIVRVHKSEAEVTNNKRLRLVGCTVEANYRQTRSIARPICDSLSKSQLALPERYLRVSLLVKFADRC